MAQQVSEIKAVARPRAGTGGARATRREGKVPGIVYGDAHEAETIALDARELSIVIGRGKFLSTVFDLDVGGKKARVIPREVQLDPVKDIAHPRRFPAHRRRRPHPRQRAGAVRQREPVAGPQARRRLERGAPRDRGDLPGRCHPGLLRVQPRGARDRPLHTHLGHQAARGRQAHHPQSRLHGRHHRRPQDRGGADPWCRGCRRRRRRPCRGRGGRSCRRGRRRGQGGRRSQGSRRQGGRGAKPAAAKPAADKGKK